MHACIMHVYIYTRRITLPKLLWYNLYNLYFLSENCQHNYTFDRTIFLCNIIYTLLSVCMALWNMHFLGETIVSKLTVCVHCICLISFSVVKVYQFSTDSIIQKFRLLNNRRFFQQCSSLYKLLQNYAHGSCRQLIND